MPLSVEAGQLLAQEWQRRDQMRAAGVDPGVSPMFRSTPFRPEERLEEAEGLWEAFETGFEQSTTGLILRQKGPDAYLQENASRAEQLSQTAGMVLGDLPTFILGGAVGGVVGGPVGAGAASFGLTEGVRTWLMEQYQQGASKQDLADRMTATAWAVAKGATVGAATAGVGGKVAQLVKPGLGGAVKVTGAELATMVGVSHALEGELPDPDAFINGAIVLGGFKGSAHIAGKLRTIYARTGKKPDEVLKEAREDSKVYQELLDKEFTAIPEKMRGAERSPLAPFTPERLSQMTFERSTGIEWRSRMGFRPNEPKTPDGRPKWQQNIEHWNETKEFKQGYELLSREIEAEMRTAQRGRVSWAQSEAEALAWMREVFGNKITDPLNEILKHRPNEYTSRVLAQAEILKRTQDAYQQRTVEIMEKVAAGVEVTKMELLEMTAARERAGRTQAIFKGTSSDLGRALNILKNPERLKMDPKLEARIDEVLTKEYGGVKQAETAAKLISEIKDAAALAELARAPTFMDKFSFVVKSFLVSGLRTHEVNLLSNFSFSLLRIPESQTQALIGLLRNSSERTTFREGIGLAQGAAIGYMQSARAATRAARLSAEEHGILKGMWEAQKNIPRSNRLRDEVGTAIDKPPIDGIIGDILNVPFKALSAGDNFMKLGNYQGSIYRQAWRQALREKGRPNMMSREFMERVHTIARNPTEKMKAEAGQDSLKYTFQEEGGAIVKNLMRLRKDVPILHVMPLPFLQTPGAIFREFFRRTPMAPTVRQWRNDWKAGGAKRDAALAEMVTGTGIMLTAFMLAREGIITGNGHPDREVRNAWYADGWQPSSIYVKGMGFVSIGRYEPVATLFTLAANIENAWELMSTGEQEDATAAFMNATAEVIHNKTWLRGISDLLNAVGHPDRYAESWLENMATLPIPQAVGQTAQMLDPYVRDVDGILDSVQSRIPVMREWLPVRRDSYGKPIKAAEGLWPSSPSTVMQRSGDPVRSEAARLGVAQPEAPREISAGSLFGESAMVELTDEQRDVFASEAGQRAYDVMKRMVRSPGWNNLTAAMQRQRYEKAFLMGRKMARLKTLTPQQRKTAMKKLREELDL